eukprot:CAMPEP_0170460220 /NCGR_PEP_ID=MMETSP0123-20130129/6673_1 /TAXON_ID=182087 /ORGANISM="Favella ehrenbergii, Strain Fehren 1" /LENGTH=73 /DNA_ID=CAMNT_0010725117 /DNA_START=474 /DNA_END=695 /DNA_ORIENTATION=-
MASLSGHSTEGILTIVSKLRELKTQMEKTPPEIDVHAYDLSNSLHTFAKLGGLPDIARLMQEQPMPSELEDEF